MAFIIFGSFHKHDNVKLTFQFMFADLKLKVDNIQTRDRRLKWKMSRKDISTENKIANKHHLSPVECIIHCQPFFLE